MGYFDLDVLQAIDAAGAFYLSRMQNGTALFAANGERLNLGIVLRRQQGHVVDMPITGGVQQAPRGPPYDQRLYIPYSRCCTWSPHRINLEVSDPVVCSS